MDTKERLQEAYINHVLNYGEQPKTVYLFAKENGLAEEEFYSYFGSFESIDQSIWTSFLTHTIEEIKGQEVWNQYTSREKALSLFYTFIEFLKSKRSFASFSLKNSGSTIGLRRLLEPMKNEFEVIASEIIQEGIDSGELLDRPYFAAKYKDALWVQFAYVLNFWIKDTSAGFDKTDEAIEKGVNVTYNFFQRSPVDDLLDYGKFLVRNSGIKMPF